MNNHKTSLEACLESLTKHTRSFDLSASEAVAAAVKKAHVELASAMNDAKVALKTVNQPVVADDPLISECESMISHAQNLTVAWGLSQLSKREGLFDMIKGKDARVKIKQIYDCFLSDKGSSIYNEEADYLPDDLMATVKRALEMETGPTNSTSTPADDGPPRKSMKKGSQASVNR